MSMPKIPDINPNICLHFGDVINLLLASIALEEIALANVINAESEKLCVTLHNLDECCCIKDLISLNESVEKVLYEVGNIESLFVTKTKLIGQMAFDHKNILMDPHKEENCYKCHEQDKYSSHCCDKYKNKGGAYNPKNDYYQNYNKITDTVSKMFGSGSNKIT
jgi:hypothetical protein